MAILGLEINVFRTLHRTCITTANNDEMREPGIKNAPAGLFKIIRHLVLLTLSAGLIASVNAKSMNSDSNTDLSQAMRDAIGQKIMLDLRYFCDDVDVSSNQCRQPMTVLPDSLKTLLGKYNIGGVVLFSENLIDEQQIKKLTDDLHDSTEQANYKVPMFIAIDQEGGRVARLPRHLFPAFAGNMAIGATYATHGSRYAYETGKAIGKQLFNLGFNINFAPNIDVNSNPANPVINIRSFSDQPDVVAELATAQILGMQQFGISSTLKHFPGHGDTFVDSHTGLPLVDKTQVEIHQTELVPFKAIIGKRSRRVTNKDFVMTAHIQYPALDPSKIESKFGEAMTIPATFSRKIITDLLKKQLGFKGLVISDALDMGAISQHFTPNQAVENVFKAGVDIALMPIAIRTPKDFERLEQLYSHLRQALKEGRLDFDEFLSSKNQIYRLKLSKKSLRGKPAKSTDLNLSEQALVKDLSNQSLVKIIGTAEKLSPSDRVLAIMPDSGKCEAWFNASRNYVSTKGLNESAKNRHQCFAITEYEDFQTVDPVAFDHLVVASLLPKQSGYEMVGTTEAERSAYAKLSTTKIKSLQDQIVKRFNAASRRVTWLSMRMPYDLFGVVDKIDTGYAGFQYNAFIDDNGQVVSDALVAFAQQLYRPTKLSGKIPIEADLVCPRSLVLCASNYSAPHAK